jgi:hypothetical protein
MLRQWGKQSNQNHSEKIRAINWFFLDGKDPNVKARFAVDQQICNVDSTLKVGLLKETFAWITALKSYIDNAIQLSDKAKIKNNRVDFYQITVKVIEKDGMDRPQYNCKHVGVYKIEDVYNCFKTIIEKYPNVLTQNNEDGEDNDPELNNAWILFDEIANFARFEEKAHYIVTRSRLDYEINVDGKILQNQNLITWHLIGEDNSQCAENYKLMNEFGILPFDIDLGRVEELKIR